MTFRNQQFIFLKSQPDGCEEILGDDQQGCQATHSGERPGMRRSAIRHPQSPFRPRRKRSVCPASVLMSL